MPKKQKVDTKRKRTNKPKVTKYDEHNTKEFDKKLETFDGIVLFHHPQCIHCVMLRPKWELMKKKLNTGGEIMEVDVGALEHSTSPVKDQVQGYPMIAHYQNKRLAHQFNEERNIDNMVRFISKYMNHKTNNLNYTYKLNKKGNVKKIPKHKQD